MDMQKMKAVLEAIAPFREALDHSLVHKDLRNCKLQELGDIMLPLDGMMEVFIKNGLEVYVFGLQFMNELLGGIATEQISHFTGLSYVLNLYELMDQSLQEAAQGIESGTEFARNIMQIKEMFSGVKKVERGEVVATETVLQDRPAEDLCQDGSISDFINEVIEGLENVEESIMELEENRDRKDLIDQVFRIMHTIKGTSGFLGMTVIGKIAHRTEDILSEVRDGSRTLSDNVFELLFTSIDTLKNLINQIRELVEGGSPERVNISDFYQILQVCKENPQGGGVVPKSAPAPSPATSSASPTGEVAPNAAAEDAEEDDSRDTKRNEPVKKAKVQEMLKVPAERLDDLSNLVGELVVALSLLAQNPSFQEVADRNIHAQVDHLDKITEALRDKVLGIRMFPIGNIFTKLARQVRDLSMKSNKKVDLEIQGADTLVDKMIIDNIYPPLIHIIRNSIDHGLEPTAERAPKPETGNVKLVAQHMGDSIEIIVSDDGRGLNVEKILAKAIEKGLAAAGKHYSDKDVYGFIFQPGFSTAQKITDISGRGVGLDVVRKTVESLRGKILIDSQVGQGTTFTLKLPLTTSIIEGLVVSVGNSRFIIPILDIFQTITPEEKNLKGVQDKDDEFFLMHGEMIPIVRLYELLDLQPRITKPSDSVIIVVHMGTKKMGIMVDELLHRQQVVIQGLSERFANLRGLTGGTILGDGRVGLILDPTSLLSASTSKVEETTSIKEMA